MAFANIVTRMNQNQAQNESWKAAGFINLYARRTDGKRTKLGFIKLRANNEAEVALLNAMLTGKVSIDQFKNMLEIDVQTAEPNNAGFAIPDAE